MTQHTPTPWILHYDKITETYSIYSTGAPGCKLGETRAHQQVGRGISQNEFHANAELIVRAVNAHDALVAACKQVLGEIGFELDPKDRDAYQKIISDAIALAEKEG